MSLTGKPMSQILKSITKFFARKAGLKVLDATNFHSSGYYLHKYLDDNGNFDYDQYKKIQEKGNKEKINLVWAQEENIQFLSQYLKKNLPTIDFGICHGTRRGLEQVWFRKYLHTEVIGTEISDTANQFPYTIQWDFHKAKPEWLGKVDFIYSNSFDHSYNPRNCLKTWISCLKPGGICIIEHSSGDSELSSNELDSFGARIEIMPYLIAIWGEGDYFLRRIIDAPKVKEKLSFIKFLIIQKAHENPYNFE